MLNKKFSILLTGFLLFALLDSCLIKTVNNNVPDYEIQKKKKPDIPYTEILTEEQKRLVNQYAPVIFQATKSKSRSGSWDLPTSVDFDGDLQGNNNEDSLISGKFNLPATVYYAIVETKTHTFITYSFFHPLDWSSSPAVIPYNWHENDMENIQIVVRKHTENSPEKAIILSTQAHVDTDVYTSPDSGVTSGNFKLTGNTMRLLDSYLNDNGTHPAVYVESGGHGIYGISSKKNEFESMYPPKLKEGLVLLPSENNTPDIFTENKTFFSYQLKPSYDIFWVNYVLKQHMGDGKLMDGEFDYKDEFINHKKLPRHFDSNRLSGPNKHDAGILPFAFSYSLTSKDLGVIFFNPAKKYQDTLKIDHEWSKFYSYNPYTDS